MLASYAVTSSTETLAVFRPVVRSRVTPRRLPTTFKAHGQTLASHGLYLAEPRCKTHEALGLRRDF